MTKFITYFNLCPIPEPKDFLGISPDKDEGNIITTLGKNIIIVIKISTQKQIRSWSVLEKLSSKVVYDKKSEKYVGVFGSKYLRCWDEGTTDVNKCKKLKFQKYITNLVSCGDDTFVLYVDGSCELLAKALESRKEDANITTAQQLELSNKLSFSNASVFVLANGSKILTYFERNSLNGDYYLVRLPLSENGAELEAPKRFKLSRENLSVTVAGAAVIEGGGVPALLTIWSDKRMFILNLSDDVCPERSPGNFVSVLTQLKVDSPLSVMGISKHFVAIYGANHGQEGASLLLYNTQFKVIKTKQFFKVYFNYSKLWSVNDHIILAMGQNLSVVKYQVLKEVLSELVGTQVSNDYQTSIEIDHINEEDMMEECLQYSKDFQTQNSNEVADADADEAGKPLKIQEADGLTIPYMGVQDFDKELNALRQLHLHVDVVNDSQLDAVHINLMSNHNDAGFSCSEIQLIAQQLERVGASEHEISEKLLTVLMKANLLKDIGVCLRRYTNISEKILSKTLNYILKRYSSASGESNEKGTKVNGIAQEEHMETEGILSRKPSASGNTSEIQDILNTLLACSFDAETIAKCIRQDMEYKEVVIILEHLYNMITSDDMYLEERPALYETSTEYELQLLRWFGVFLNSHFQKLALSKEVALIELLFKWHELFQSYRQEIVELQNVAALLHNVVERRTVAKEKSSSKWYSIEEVYLF
ncbi:nucleolar protein 11 [Musca domestica]|uniref:Nucleolar protein 11 n=1 Tax=Musca domestica TaxID=7370 RepID=A0A9J7CRF5_MUSDO|nr:nucleolar protein 11 [Musca domestica]